MASRTMLCSFKTCPWVQRAAIGPVKALLLAALALAPALALAQAYPSKPIRVITPFPAGAGADNITRRAAEELYSRLGQPLVHELLFLVNI